jgi:hypothetical protein
MITLWFQRIERGRMADVDADVETLGRTEAVLVVEGEMGEVLGVRAREGTGEVGEVPVVVQGEMGEVLGVGVGEGTEEVGGVRVVVPGEKGVVRGVGVGGGAGAGPGGGGGGGAGAPHRVRGVRRRAGPGTVVSTAVL